MPPFNLQDKILVLLLGPHNANGQTRAYEQIFILLPRIGICVHVYPPDRIAFIL